MIGHKIELASPYYYQFKEYIANQYLPSYEVYEKTKDNFLVNFFRGTGNVAPLIDVFQETHCAMQHTLEFGQQLIMLFKLLPSLNVPSFWL